MIMNVADSQYAPGTLRIGTGDSQMDVDNGFRAVLEKFIEFDKVHLIKSHGSIELVGHNPRAASGFRDVYRVWLKCQHCQPAVPGTRATQSFITGHWNWFPDFPETII
jgi:hypothetical protein